MKMKPSSGVLPCLGRAGGAAPSVLASLYASYTLLVSIAKPAWVPALPIEARTLREQGVRLRHPLDVVVWQNEEGGTIGSKLAINDLTAADLDKVARSGKTIREGIALVGGNVDRLAHAVKKPSDFACYVELHSEQGGLLQ